MRAEEKQSTVVQGTLHMLVLKTLALEPMHGYGIGVRLEQISRGVFQVNAGSLFPALRRLERDGLITGEWRATENNRRAKYYLAWCSLFTLGSFLMATPILLVGWLRQRRR